MYNDGVWGLKDSSFTVDEGELAVLVGPNGAGKTTCVKILTTVLKPSRGKAEVLGFDVSKDYKKIRESIAYLPQGFSVSVDLTPMEAIKWSLVARGCSLSDATLEARRWVDLMGLWYCRNRSGWTLSGGERRKMTVASVLAIDAKVIFLDEPTTGLDVEARHEVYKVIRETVRKGATILLTTHDMREAEIIADSVILIDKGRTSIQGKPKELVKSLSFKYRVMVKKDKSYAFPSSIIDLGDRVIIYAKDQNDVRNITSQLADVTAILSVEEVGLEDAYLHLIHGEGYDAKI